MSLKVGIVGLPNVGKSTLFNALTNSQAEVANYPFATINPNRATVAVPDERLNFLANLFQSKKKIAANVEFFDIAGLIAGAAKGEGLGNAFLANIRETNVLVHVVRGFADKEIVHVNNKINPVEDIEIINLELILADEEVVKKRLERLKSAKQKVTLPIKQELDLLLKIQKHLTEGKLVNQLNLSEAEKKLLNNLQLLTAKPFIYVVNVSDQDLKKPNSYVRAVENYLKKFNFPIIPISANLEVQLSDLDEEEKRQLLTDYGVKDSGLSKLIQEAYYQLGYQTFFTAGPRESRAWSFEKGITAPEGAGLIHSDLQRGFIKVDVYHFNDLKELGSEKSIKDNGRLRLEGKNYLLKDGDVCYFRFNI